MRRRDGLIPRAGGVLGFRYKTKEGVWKEKSCSTTVREEAIRFREDWLDRLKEDELPGDQADWTVAAACQHWIKVHSAKLCREAQRNERNYLAQLLRHPMAQKRLQAITLADLEEYQLWRSQTVKARPVNCELAILVAVLKKNSLWRGPLRGNPGAPGSGYRRLKEAVGEFEAITELELQRLELVAASKDAWLVAHCVMVTAVNSGLRGIEIKRLRLRDVDLDAGQITVRRSKSEAGRRLVCLNAPALAAVRKLYERAQLLGADLPEHYLLPADLSAHTKTGDPLKGGYGFDPSQHQRSWDTSWRGLRKAAGLKVGFHQLRHCFITRLAEQGTPLQVTQAMVGHTTAEVTKRYTHISNQAMRDAVTRLEANRNVPHFVDVFVDVATEEKSKLLN